MKRSLWIRLIAVILVISMLAAPVSAATMSVGGSNGSHSLIGAIIGGIVEIIRDIIREIVDDWFDGPGDEVPDPTNPTEPIETTAPTTPEETTEPTEPVETEPSETEPTDPSEPTEPVETPETILNLIEGATNTENSSLLRGFTYAFGEKAETEPQTAPFALRSAGANTFALNALNALNTTDVAAAAETTTVSDTALVITYDENGNAIIPDGDYVVHHYEGTGSYLTVTSNTSNPWGAKAIQGAMDKASASYLTFTRLDDGTYTIQGPGKWYLTIPQNNQAYTQAAPVAIEIKAHSDGTGVTLKDTDSSLCMNALDYVNQYPKGNSYFGGWTEGSPFKLYAVTTTVTPEEPEESEDQLVYFPVTMYDYDEETFDAITHAMDIAEDPDAATWNGFYFSNGSPDAATFTTSTESGTATKTRVTYDLVVPTFNSSGYISNLDTNSEYILVNKRLGKPVVSGTSTLPEGSAISGAGDPTLIVEFNEGETVTEIGGASIWKYSTSNSSPRLRDTSNRYLYIASASAYAASTSATTYIEKWDKDANCVVLRQRRNLTNYYLSDLYGASSSNFAGYNVYDDDGNPFYIYKKVSTETVEVPVTVTETYGPKGFAAWNKWTYGVYNGTVATEQNKFYSGLVQDKLDENNNIVFNVNEPGIFTYDELNNNSDGTKYVYEYVGLPFVKNSKGYYTFDSDKNGVHFPATSNNQSTIPASGSGDKTREDYMYNMTFLPDAPQTWDGMNYGDGSTNLWAPYDTPQKVSEETSGGVNYHFGMKAHIPFSMTKNGYVKEVDTDSDPITFTFAGDDDVWIFIDGQLVIDLGGIHNRLGATIDFAANTITYEIPDSNENRQNLGSFNEADKYPVTDNKIVLNLFDKGTTQGLIDMTLETFASNENHYMSIFYLERGKGTSNCKIEFNLPMLDTVSVTKNITHSWSEETGEEYPLTPQEKAFLANKPFYFTLYRKTADSEEPVPVCNTNYYLVKTDGTSTIQTTGPDGSFPLKNGQTAKFMTDIPGEGITYFVVEEDLGNGYLTPDFTFGGTATYGFDYSGVTMDDGPDGRTEISGHVADGALIPEQEIPLDAEENKSFEITAKGSIQSIDSISFICENYLNEQLANPSSLAEEDIIVIDYGLPVEIDPLVNDVFRGDNIEIVYFQAGDVEFGGEDGIIDQDEGDALCGITDVNGDGIISTEESASLSSKPDISGHSGTFHFIDAQYRAEFDDDGNMIDYARDSFTYTLNKQLTEVEVLTYLVRVNGSRYQESTETTNYNYCYGQAKLYIVPATIMYYEENFADLVTFTGSRWVGEVKTSDYDEANSPFQERGVVGEGYSTYGSDVNYLEDSMDSNGTSYYGDTSGASTNNPTAGAIQFSYTFTGTGTSIFARTSATTGYMQVKVYKGSDTSGTMVNMVYRDTYYNNSNTSQYDDGEFLYNIPVFTESDLHYGTYHVVVTIAKEGSLGGGPNLEHTGKDFYLDGIRIMQPLNEDANMELTDKALDAYATDGESNLEVVTLRQKLITDAQIADESAGIFWDNENFVVLTDTNGAITTAEEYTSIGPKEEVYLAPGQTVSFSLKYWEPAGLKLYMGMKAPFGGAELNVGSTSFSLKNATDCYYDVTDCAASLLPKRTEMFTEEGYPLYTDANGNVVIEVYSEENDEFYYYDEEGNLLTDVDADALEPLMEEYYEVTYTFQTTSSIVALTNIKVVGNFEFVIVEDYNDDFEGSEGEGSDDIIVDP